ncbi:Succinate dehydrogenase assembly factor 4, mitochondrial [Teratosphaeria destructans]|uniref:Succinate dehydrogenase assembly factor 4, mitochondrial n=1 Tax=Teratosphaeria destructans TaxID=418781 RepID=A0A9W7SK77_9PEZI|nr:Succinate dehydrogenase assembly factor 4, mitochondrial [Teratosphaeria destructans]
MRPFFALRTFTSQPASRSRWTPGPAPPRLPKEEQELFEKLQQESTGAFSTPRQAEDASRESQQGAETAESSSSHVDQMLEQLRERARLAAKGDGEELHPNVRRGAAPEFEGDTNPKTGEVGGPKNDPLRWKGDWSYNGRVTDF